MGKQLGRKNNKRKLKWILAGIVIALLLAGGGIYAGFMVTDITYTGNKHYTQQQMTECIFGTEHPNALIYTLFGKKNKNIPFIQKYDVEVTWPNKMNVAVYEKRLSVISATWAVICILIKTGLWWRVLRKIMKMYRRLRDWILSRLYWMPNSRSVTMRSFHRFWN